MPKNVVLAVKEDGLGILDPADKVWMRQSLF
jgi:hypothetical protein